MRSSLMDNADLPTHAYLLCGCEKRHPHCLFGFGVLIRTGLQSGLMLMTPTLASYMIYIFLLLSLSARLAFAALPSHQT